MLKISYLSFVMMAPFFAHAASRVRPLDVTSDSVTLDDMYLYFSGDNANDPNVKKLFPQGLRDLSEAEQNASGDGDGKDDAAIKAAQSDIDQANAELSVVQDMDKSTLGRLTEGDNVTALLKKAFATDDIGKFTAAAAAYRNDKGTPKTAKAPDDISRDLKVPGSHVVVTATLTTDKDGNPVMKFHVNAPKDLTKFDKGLAKELKDAGIDPTALQKILDTDINAKLDTETLAVNQTDGEPDGKVLADLGHRAATLALAGHTDDNKDGALASAVAHVESELNPDDEYTKSTMNDLKQKLADVGGDDTGTKAQRLHAKRALMKYMMNNDTSKISKCDAYKAAMKWEEIPKDVQDECTDLEKADKKAKGKDDSSSDDGSSGHDDKPALKPKTKADQADYDASVQQKLNAANTQQVQQQATQIDRNFADIVQYCMAMYQNKASQSGFSQIQNTLGPAYQQLLKQGFASKMFGEMVGDAALGGMDLTLDATSPYRAAKIAHSVPAGKDGIDQLNQERDSIGKIMQLAGNLLSQLASNYPMGLNDPSLINDPKVQQLRTYFQAAQALSTAIDNELNARKSTQLLNQPQLQPLGYGTMNSTNSGVPTVGGSTTNGARTNGLSPGARGFQQTNPLPTTPVARPNLLN